MSPALDSVLSTFLKLFMYLFFSSIFFVVFYCISMFLGPILSSLSLVLRNSILITLPPSISFFLPVYSNPGICVGG